MINYYLITKPGIILGNLLTVAAGFILASKGVVDGWLFLATLMGLGFIMASACVFNNFIDRKIDKKMKRTQGRALVNERISGQNAIVYAIILGIIGNVILFTYTNLLTVGVAALGFFVYVILYSLWKCRTVYGTAIGSIAGAVPPIVGYCAVSNHFDLGALILFAIMVFWQMPHFFSIALFHLEDYAAAGVPVLPLERGVKRTKIHMVIYIICFIVAAACLTLFDYTGYLFLATAIGLGLAWLALSIAGFNRGDTLLWGKQMFSVSLIVIMTICLIIPFDVIGS